MTASRRFPPEEDTRRSGWRPLIIVAGAILASLVGIGVWLAVNGEDTMNGLRAALPQVIVPVFVQDPEPAPREPEPIKTEPDPVSPPPEAPAPQTTPPETELPQEEPASVDVEQPPAPPPADDQITANGALLPAPIPDLVDNAPEGQLPKISSEGRKPWQAYARPFDPTDPRPRIAIVMTDMGLSAGATETAIQGLPGSVTLAFAPYAQRLPFWLDQARAAGHEALINLPMEPTSFPSDDPGPQALLTSADVEQNLMSLRWSLSRVTGYVGATSFLGSRFTADAVAMRPVLEELNARGLLYFDSRASERTIAPRIASEIGLPRVVTDRVVDRIAARSEIDRELAALEREAIANGVAVGLAHPFPVTFERLSLWLPSLERKGIVLAPVSALADLQPDPF